jgi:hypothetical protein
LKAKILKDAEENQVDIDVSIMASSKSSQRPTPTPSKPRAARAPKQARKPAAKKAKRAFMITMSVLPPPPPPPFTAAVRLRPRACAVGWGDPAPDHAASDGVGGTTPPLTPTLAARLCYPRPSAEILSWPVSGPVQRTPSPGCPIGPNCTAVFCVAQSTPVQSKTCVLLFFNSNSAADRIAQFHITWYIPGIY